MKKSHVTAKKEPHHLSKDTAQPVVIHHPDETVLAQWVREALQKGPRFWLTVLLTVALAVALFYGVVGLLSRPPEGASAWFELMVPSVVPPSSTVLEEGMPPPARPLLAIAERHPDTAAARWALIRAGTLLYEEALRDLPARREVARPRLAQALELFNRALASAPADAPEAIVAAMCKARALETRGELEDAIAQYKEVAETWPTSDQARAASKRAALLAQPEVQKFYRDFYETDFANVIPPSTDPLPGGVPSPASMLPGESRTFGTPLVPPLPQGALEQPADADTEKAAESEPVKPPTTPDPPKNDPLDE